ncbi:hypothetical protein NPIL_622661 [Nephila pilipes]|uniref:Uncharacterized protein n=1 Tax=Nephila pilipes TaxID=299642 RepID=A0A8X6N1L8_NEPPI|nr:hypothetical protein NPIL_622661 [Nephila pilipes]
MHWRKEKKKIQDLENKRKQQTQGINIQQNLQKDFPPFTGHATKGYPIESPAKIQPPNYHLTKRTFLLHNRCTEILRNPQVKEIFEHHDQVIRIPTFNLSKYQKKKPFSK